MRPQLPQQDNGTRCLVGESVAWRRLMERVEAIAISNAPVLIQGEQGSGKEVVARAVHEASPRRDHPFVVVDCTALKGGCDADTVTGTMTSGLLAAAEGGTLFLDEIGKIGGTIQTRFLRVLDCGEYRHVGGTLALTAHVRVVCSTSQDLQKLVLAGRFHDDLLYRISTIGLCVPSLRERPVDIPLLAHHFLRSHHSLERPPRLFSPAAIEELVRYEWPGNVRELRTLIERVVQPSSVKSADPIGPNEVRSLLSLDD